MDVFSAPLQTIFVSHLDIKDSRWTTTVRTSVRTTRSLMKALAEAHIKADQSFDFPPAGGPKSENIPELKERSGTAPTSNSIRVFN